MTLPAPSIDRLVELVSTRRRLLVITGAGCSQPSGIPTYRNDDAEWQRTAPIQHQDFIRKPESRQRYWARSFAGWPAVRDADPNHAHKGLAALERTGRIKHLVTQNVDGLHQKAGHTSVTELHGSLASVICLACADVTPRQDMQARLHDANPVLGLSARSLAPDGDAEVPEDLVSQLVVPDCSRCGGILKPNVVFYGGSVPKPVVRRANEALNEADALLAVGTSLMVFSAFRFARRAAERDLPIVIINRGRTRADDLASIRHKADCQATMKTLLQAMGMEET